MPPWCPPYSQGQPPAPLSWLLDLHLWHSAMEPCGSQQPGSPWPSQKMKTTRWLSSLLLGSLEASCVQCLVGHSKESLHAFAKADLEGPFTSM